MVDSAAAGDVDIDRPFLGYMDYGIEREAPDAHGSVGGLHLIKEGLVDAVLVIDEVEHDAEMMVGVDAGPGGDVPAVVEARGDWVDGVGETTSHETGEMRELRESGKARGAERDEIKSNLLHAGLRGIPDATGRNFA